MSPVEATLTIIGLVIAGIVGWFNIMPVIDKARRDFLAAQPDVVVGGAYILSSGNQYTASLKLHNLGKSTAYNAKILMDGLTEEKDISVIHPLRPGHNEYEVTLELGKTSELRTAVLDNPLLRIIFYDRWNYKYELSYPVAQTPRADGLVNVQILLEQPTLKKPRVSFFKMRSHLNELPGSH